MAFLDVNLHVFRINMKNLISLIFGMILALNLVISAHGATAGMEKINIGKKLALYPSVVAVVGAIVDGKVNWMTIAYTGTSGIA